MDALRSHLTAFGHWLLPPQCLLCGDAGHAGLDLCRDCAAELPRNTRCCSRCALPLALPAELCGRCQRKPPPWDAAWAPFRYG
jgi:predicted amidophosphoribosyltransferase